jgi:hypothetical protein
MRIGFLGAIATLLSGATLACAQVRALPEPLVPADTIVRVVYSDVSPGSSGSRLLDSVGPSCSGPCCDGPECCVPCQPPCGPPGRIWASGEYLLWWIKNASLPPLVTASPASSGGILGMPGTTVLFGGTQESQPFSGGRFDIGFWLDSCQTIGLDTEFFFLGSRGPSFINGAAGTPGSTFIARPFFDVLTGTENAEAVAAPGILSGTVTANLRSSLWGIEENALCNLCCGCCYRIDLLAGFRYLQFNEDLDVREDLAVLPGVPGIGGTRIALGDDFNTRNEFYGGQIGAFAEFRKGNLFLDILGKVALGDDHEIVDIHGVTVFTPPGGLPTPRTGGLLALPTNSGRFHRDEFAVLPEASVNVGYQVTDHMRAFVGYTFLYLSNVVRPGDQVDLGINATQLPTASGPGTLVGPARPTFAFRDTDFWAQGINFGLEFRY